MNTSTKGFLKNLGVSILFWSIATTSYIIFRYMGIEGENFTPLNIQGTSFSQFLIYGCYTGILFGTFHTIVNAIFDKYYKKRLNALFIIVLNLVSFILLLILTINIISFLFFEEEQNSSLISYLNWWITSTPFWTFLYYISTISLVLSFIKIATERFGFNQFYKILIGKYRIPKEEKRIFMFLDLKSSTAIAEKMGHVKHSQLLQDCFYDLNEIAPNYNAEIYQYVGDEAVLTWPYQKGIRNQQCIALFFAFQQKLESRADHYRSTYGLIPNFKAGIHGGKLMVAEVGTVKKEIAYHGDVINTTARIQSKCNEYNQQLLVSEALLNDMEIQSNYTAVNIGTLTLKGKTIEMALCGIKEN